MIRGKPQDGTGFFDTNPDLEYVPEFKELIAFYNKEGNGKERAGKLIWAIWLVCHPDSGLFDMPRADKRRWVVDNFMNGEAIDWDSQHLADVIKVFPHLTMTMEERMYYDAQMLYEMSIAEARHLAPGKRVDFIKSMGATAAHIEALRKKYEDGKFKEEEAAGDAQSGWASKQKRQR